jgi:serine/threonine-protein kinase
MRGVDRACDDFEKAWRAGGRPRIEDYVAGVPAADQPTARRELLALEIELRKAAGELPRTTEYRDRFPEVLTLGGREDLPEVLPLPPRYQLVGLIGRGGVGAVFRCRDRELGRDLALKVLLEEHRERPERVARFVREAQVSSQLQHPGIVPVYEVGQLAGGLPYFTMKLVEGYTFADLLEQRQGTAQELPRWLGVFAPVCQAVAYAHSRGVIHRDLKPANVMVGAFGEVLVMDWGMAKVLMEAREGSPSQPDHSGTAATVCALEPGQLTENDLAMGTPAYMPPEQARGEIDHLDARSDVFALGAILCEVLTGQPPYPGPAAGAVARARRADVGAALARLDDCGADHKLIALARHCLAAEPDGRPRNAAVVAEAMTTYLAELEARKTAAEVNAVKERGRRRLQVTVVAAVAMLVLCVIGTWAWVHSDAMAEKARQETEAARDVFSLLEEADRMLATGRPEAAKEVLGKAQGRAGAAPQAVRRQVEGRARNLRMAEQLMSIRLLRSQPGAAPGRPLVERFHPEGFAWGRSAAEQYADVFRTYGIDIKMLEPADAGRRIRNRPIQAFLVTILDDWAFKTVNPTLQKRLWAVAAEADDRPDALAGRVRSALTTADAAALRRLAAAVAPNESPAVLFLLASALRRHGSLPEAVRLLTVARQRHRGDFWLNLELGTALALQPRADQGDSRLCIEAALAVSDSDPGVYMYLGNSLATAGSFADAADAYREAVALAPKLVVARINLGIVLGFVGRLKEARKGLEAVVAQEPDNALACYNLGVVLQQQGENAAAIEAYRKAVGSDPGFAEAWSNLGNSLTGLGRREEAVAAFEKALAARPGYARAHFNLGCLYDDWGRCTKAMSCYRQAIACKPDYAEAYYNMAFDLLYKEGKFSAARKELVRGRKYLPSDDTRGGHWEAQIELASKLGQLEPQLDAVLQGKGTPATAAEACDMARLCGWAHRQRYAAAAELYVRAFNLEPARAKDLVQGYRYQAAQHAAQAGCGRDRDSATLGAMERARWRIQALTWLRADLARRRNAIEHGNKGEAHEAGEKLRYWQTDCALSGVRQPALRSLPVPEQEGWRALWNEVEALLRKGVERGQMSGLSGDL